MPDWTPAEVHILTLHVERGDNAEQTSQALREAGFDRSHQAVRRYLQRHPEIHARVAPSPVRCIDRPPVLKGDALVIADVHAPLHDSTWINRCVDMALSWGVRKLAIGGDLVDFGAFSIFEKSGEYGIGEEIRATEQIIKTFEGCFDEIVYGNGNHEQRLSRRTEWLLPVEHAVRLFMRDGKVTFTRSHWFTVESGGETFMVTHPKNTSVNQTVVPAKLAAKYHMHAIAGHGHLWGQGRDVSGLYWAIDLGICADVRRLEYYVEQPTIRPVMQQGACIIKGGVPYLLSPHNIAGFESLRLAA